MDDKLQKHHEPQDAENDLLNLVQRYIAHWKWFAVGVILALIAAFVFVKFQTPLYEVEASILIKDEKKGAGLSELSAFEDLGLLKKANNIDNEIEVLKSRTLMTLVAQELRLNVHYVLEDKPIDRELYSESPVYIRFLDGDSVMYTHKGVLTVRPVSNTGFQVLDDNKVLSAHKFGDVVKSSFGKISILATRDLQQESFVNRNIHISLVPLDKVVEDLRREIKIDPVNKTSNVIVISLRHPVKDKAAAIIDNLIRQHNADAIADKNQVSKNTAEFINDRIKFITTELSTVESEAEEFKTRHKLVDVASEAKLFLETGSESTVKILEANTQKALASYMYDYIVKNDKPGDLIPANLGLSDQAVSTMILEYNRLVLDRNKILRNSSEQNPVVENLSAQLNGMRKSIRESLKNYAEALNIQIQELTKQELGISSKIASVPRYEREYRIIQRQQQIKETLYLYLLQKREETNIALAVTVSNAKVIDRAYSKKEPVSPKRKIIFLIALAIGIAVPLLVLYVRDLLDNKVHGKRDIDRIGIPFLGDIPDSKSDDKLVVGKNENSSVAEAFRLLRTNVDFMLGGSKSSGSTIFLTSTLSKEGKSFVAMNLAASIAISGKKVLLVGMDVRAPKVLQYFGMDDKLNGLTNYVSDPDISLQNVIIRLPDMPNLAILPSGTIPPNPAELLMHPRIGEMFAQVKPLYDYIIVDTAPIGMVTDTLLLSDYADAFVFVVRAYFLDRRLLSVAADLYREKRLPNMAILINGTDKEKGYGYGYGYGYGGYGYGREKPRPFWKRIFNR